MKRTQQTSPAVDTVTADDVADTYVDGVAQIDADRAAAYAGLGTLSVTKSKSLERERTLLTRKYGDQHPRVLAVQERIKVNTVFSRDLAVITRGQVLSIHGDLPPKQVADRAGDLVQAIVFRVNP